MTKRPWLIADLGGTNARFALADPDTHVLHHEYILPTASAPTIVALAKEYLEQVGGSAPDLACFACAGPITDDRCSLTNAEIDFFIEPTRRELGLERLLVVNDFAATARAIPELESVDVVQIGNVPPSILPGALAIGPGTGLGVAAIRSTGRGWHVIPGEGGHVALSAIYDDELEIVRRLRVRYGFASAEMVISGPGLTRLFLILAAMRGEQPTEASRSRPSVIVERAVQAADPTSVATLEMFCRLLAATAANAALVTGATGGVFLAGGILARFPDFVASSSFRERFTTHPHVGRYLAQIATTIITTDQPGLRGALHLLLEGAG